MTFGNVPYKMITLPKDKLIAAGIGSVLMGYIELQLSRHKGPAGKSADMVTQEGMSQEKYMASLLQLSYLELIDIHSMIGVNYKVLRNWQSEQLYSDVRDEHRKEFVDYMVRKVIGKRKKDKSLVDTLLANEWDLAGLSMRVRIRLMVRFIRELENDPRSEEDKQEVIEKLEAVVFGDTLKDSRVLTKKSVKDALEEAGKRVTKALKAGSLSLSDSEVIKLALKISESYLGVR